ncbi:MAG: hypothetical protein J6T88_09965 [Bacteroidales bacterium]|nr:hypothetical protein [Bacteroidales bacterium]
MKKIIIRLILFSVPFILLAINYILITKTRERSGDLGRVGHYFFEKGYHTKLSPEIEEKYVRDIPIDSLPDSIYILSVGDSFSNKLLSVQRWNEYTGKAINKKIINIPPCNLSPANIILSYLSVCPNDKLPKIIIMETVERESIPILSSIDINHPESLDDIKYMPKDAFGTSPNSLRNAIEFYQRKLGMSVHLVSSNLTKPVFSSKGDESKLICYYQDTTHFSDAKIRLAVDNLQRLYNLAEQRGVQLFYLICPNKANVYWPYIKDKDKNMYFNILDQTNTFDTLPYIFNPLPILRQKLNEGELDIFYCDDTHWPPKTAKIVGEALAEWITLNY